MRRVVQPAPGQLSDEELLVRAALGDRERQRSGKALRLQAAAVLALIAVGCWLVLVLGRIPYAGWVGIGLGAAACSLAVSFAFGLAGLSPAAAWGSPVRVRCPGCGQRTLREGRAIHWEAHGPARRTLHGVVTLCLADDCGHAAVRQVRQWTAVG
jgi:hypothetical protein